jgi:hypothetical protein
MNRPYITIVSGLPRSGTSMMMQLLASGGIAPLTDNLRQKDEDNPKGYYEYEPVKKTKVDSSWVPLARGKVVKMVYRLLYDLPDDFDYRVIFMQRDLNEVIASQNKMLERSGEKGAGVADETLANLFKKEIDIFKKRMAQKENFTILAVDYKEMIDSPQSQCARINDFLDNSLNLTAATQVVDSKLYRNRG